MILFIAGLFVGATIGTVLMAALAVAGQNDADRR